MEVVVPNVLIVVADKLAERDVEVNRNVIDNSVEAAVVGSTVILGLVHKGQVVNT